MPPENNNPQDIAKLRERFEKLDKKKTIAETNLKNSSDKLEDLKKEAREKYGTDDLAELRAKLQQMTDENERKRAEYQEHLTSIETELDEVERKHTEAGRKEN